MARNNPFHIDGAPELTDEQKEKLGLEKQVAALRGQLKASEATARRYLEEATRWEERFDTLAALREPVAPVLVPPGKSVFERRGVALVNWSDWHVAEMVNPSMVQGRNSYSPEIAKKRAGNCSASTVGLWRYIRKSYHIDRLILFLGGDFISGYLHPELEQTNAMGPVEEARFAEQLLLGALEPLIAERSIGSIDLVMMRGNHGRTTKKIQFKNDYKTSLESWIYWHLADVLSSKRVRCRVPPGDVFLLPITRDWSLRLFHGHQVRYQDGVGGVTIPLNKWEAKQDKTAPAQYNLMGHYHFYSQPNAFTTLNGSLKGWDEFAASIGDAFQPPLQTFALLDTARRMVAQHLPIFCE